MKADMFRIIARPERSKRNGEDLMEQNLSVAGMEERKYFKGVLPWLLLGPITGPLAEGVVRNWRAGETCMAWIYALTLSLTTFDLYHFGGQFIALMVRLCVQ